MRFLRCPFHCGHHTSCGRSRTCFGTCGLTAEAVVSRLLSAARVLIAVVNIMLGSGRKVIVVVAVVVVVVGNV